MKLEGPLTEQLRKGKESAGIISAVSSILTHGAKLIV